jgi:hypothetical protein
MSTAGFLPSCLLLPAQILVSSSKKVYCVIRRNLTECCTRYLALCFVFREFFFFSFFESVLSTHYTHVYRDLSVVSGVFSDIRLKYSVAAFDSFNTHSENFKTYPVQLNKDRYIAQNMKSFSLQ